LTQMCDIEWRAEYRGRRLMSDSALKDRFDRYHWKKG
jgi:hypothetical protein